jgi:hypothetical protein
MKYEGENSTMLSSPAGRELIQGLEETGKALVSEFIELDDVAAGESPEPDEWSAKQNLAHLAEIEPGLVAEALSIITNPDTTIGHPPGTLWGEAQDTANSRPIADLVREFDAVNAQTLERLALLNDEDLSRPGKHRGVGDVTVQGALLVVLAHRRGHLFQHRSNMVGLRGRQAGRMPADAYSIVGEGEPTLVLVDAAASKWGPVATELSRGQRVVHVRVGALPSTLEQLRRDLNLREFWLGGVASSAVDACKYAFAYPERLAGLVLVNLSVLPMSRDGRPDDFSAIRAPTLTLVGEGYPQATLAQERGRQFSNGRTAVVSGAGRDVPREQPAAVTEAIRSFVPIAIGRD